MDSAKNNQQVEKIASSLCGTAAVDVSAIEGDGTAAFIGLKAVVMSLP